MKFLKLISLVFLFLSIFCCRVFSEEATIPRFYVDYCVVQHTLKNDKGYSEQLMKIAELDINAGDFLAEFWFNRAKTSCFKQVERVISSQVNIVKAQKDKTEQAKMIEKLKDEISQCYYAFYFEHWDEINKTILDTYSRVLREQAELKNDLKKQTR